MLGTIINTAAILAGGVAGLLAGRGISERTQFKIKLILGVLTIFTGFKMTWEGINGSFLQVLKQLAIILTALILGNLIGKTIGLQKQINKLGEWARRSFEQTPGENRRFGEGFVTCTILFCVGPMAILGAMEDGLQGKIRTLGIKSVMDGLATAVFVKTFGWGVMLAALPVLAYQGSITLAARSLEPYLHDAMLLNSISATGGLLVLCISVVILDIAKVPLADYLPSLAVAPILTWLLR